MATQSAMTSGSTPTPGTSSQPAGVRRWDISCCCQKVNARTVVTYPCEVCIVLVLQYGEGVLSRSKTLLHSARAGPKTYFKYAFTNVNQISGKADS